MIGGFFMKRKILSCSLLTLFIIMFCLVSYGCDADRGEIVACFPKVAKIEFSSLDELRAGVKRAKEKELDSEHESSYEAIKLADLERTLVPPLDFDGFALLQILAAENEITYVYANRDDRSLLVEISRPEVCTAESVYAMKAEKYGEENEIEQFLYNKERGVIVSIVDDFCVCIYAGKEQPMNDFEYLKSCFRFENISFDS